MAVPERRSRDIRGEADGDSSVAAAGRRGQGDGAVTASLRVAVAGRGVAMVGLVAVAVGLRRVVAGWCGLGVAAVGLAAVGAWARAAAAGRRGRGDGAVTTSWRVAVAGPGVAVVGLVASLHRTGVEHRLRRTAVGIAAALAMTVLWAGPLLAAVPAIAWSRYQAAARSVLALQGRGPVHLAPGSPLRGTVIRFPDGTEVHVDPGLLVSGLAAQPGSSSARSAWQSLAAIAAAPAHPRALPPAGVAARRLAAVLRDPAFAAIRPGPLWGLQRWVLGLWNDLLGLIARGLNVPAPLARDLLIAAGIVVLLAAGFAVFHLVPGARLERGERRRERPQSGRVRPAPAGGLPEARRRLQAGDVPSAMRLIYMEALRLVEARRRVSIRPGWTAREIRIAAGLDTAWPAFASLAAFHARVLFAPAPPAAGGDLRVAKARAWLQEVDRWGRGAAG